MGHEQAQGCWKNPPSAAARCSPPPSARQAGPEPGSEASSEVCAWTAARAINSSWPSPLFRGETPWLVSHSRGGCSGYKERRACSSGNRRAPRRAPRRLQLRSLTWFAAGSGLKVHVCGEKNPCLPPDTPTLGEAKNRPLKGLLFPGAIAVGKSGAALPRSVPRGGMTKTASR